MFLLSVIIPACNMASFLPACLRSLEAAPANTLEAIVVDDGSTDDTAAIAEQWAAAVGPRLRARVIRKPNGHYGSCINAALAIATGRYVRTLDADDVYDPDELAKFLAVLAAHTDDTPPADAFFTDYAATDVRRRTVRTAHLALPEGAPFARAEITALPDTPTVHGMTYRTDFLRAIGYRQTEGIAYSDNDWAVLPLLHLATARYAPLCVYRYCIGRDGQSVSAASRLRNLGDVWTLFTNWRTHLLSRGTELSPEARSYFRRRLLYMARDYLQTAFLLLPLKGFDTAFAAHVAKLREADPVLLADVEENAVVLTSIRPIRFLKVWNRLRVGRAAWVRSVRLAVHLANLTRNHRWT